MVFASNSVVSKDLSVRQMVHLVLSTESLNGKM